MWTDTAYSGGDPSIELFDWAARSWPILRAKLASTHLHAASIGCCEETFVEEFARRQPNATITGVDQREWGYSGPGNGTCRIGNALDERLFPPHTLDLVVFLGSLEHIGLGFYGDPQDVAGDSQAVENARLWLKPAGLLYFDVPYNPSRYFIPGNRHYRCYDDAALWSRVIRAGMMVEGMAWSDAEPRRFTGKPSHEVVPFQYVMVCLRSAGV